MSIAVEELAEHRPPPPTHMNGNGHRPEQKAPSAAPPTKRSAGSWFRNRGLATKILVAPIVAALAMVVIGVIGSANVGGMAGEVDTMYDQGVVPIQELGTVRASFLRARVAVLYHLLATDAAGKQQREQDLAAADGDLRKALEAYKPIAAEGTAEDVKALEDSWSQYYAGVQNDIFPLSRRDDVSGAMAKAGQYAAMSTQAEQSIDKLIQAEQQDALARREAAQATASSSRTQTLAVMAAAVALAIALALWISRLIVRPLKATVDDLERVAEGDLTVDVSAESTDEVGQMRTALGHTLRRVREAVASFGSNAQVLSSSSEELSAVSHQMASNAEETSNQSNVVAAASEQVSSNIATVATGSEEMSASIKEIAKNANDAAQVATEGMSMAEATNATVAKLSTSSGEIGEVIDTITSIAEQTNLLALNATIEAARAGEAGKGFAIVANEVKELAKETSAATEEISSRIETIQSDASEAVAAIAQIVELIGKINDAQSTIASAVEEQTATTNEIGRNVTEAAGGAGEIARNVASVAEAAASTASGATQTQQAAEELARLSMELQRLVDQFTY